jgi:hypothetical protein
VSAYLTRAELSLVAADGTRVVVEAGDYVEAVDVFGAGMDARRRAEWLAVMRLGLERDPPRRRQPDELEAHPVLILDVRGRMVYAHADDLFVVDDD